ncbi:hypothetical protein [Paraburkholderia fungorum]|uniref:hypothetical protein n=1 Tax=Paraburkholderia fungorum TaxID=134537 RepID=UPI0038BB19D9
MEIDSIREYARWGRWGFVDLFAFGGGIFLVPAALAFPCFVIGLFARHGGLSLFCYWSISVAPVRGRHLLFFAAAKKSRQKKAAHTANS